MWIKLHKNQFCGLVSGRKQNFGSQKTTNQVSYILPICRDVPNGAIVLNFGMMGNIADLLSYLESFRQAETVPTIREMSPLKSKLLLNAYTNV